MFDWFKKKCEHQYYVQFNARSGDTYIREGVYFQSYLLTCVHCGHCLDEKIVINNVPQLLRTSEADAKYSKTIELRLYTKYKIVNKL